MEQTPTTPLEKKILISYLIGWTTVPAIAIIAYLIYFFFYAAQPEYLVFVMLIVVLILIYARWAFRLYRDISLNVVTQGKATVSYSGITFMKDRYIHLDKFDKRRITLQGKAWYKLKAGDVIKYRIATQSGLLLSYEIF
jgi:membrane protein implicated in regulation of membrane protease activity